ncbi:MAG: hypothetical protein V3W44_09920 [Dehalococcoidales bacterium]
MRILVVLLILSFGAVADASDRWPQLSKPKIKATAGLSTTLRIQRERVRARYERHKTKRYTITNRRTGKTVRLRVGVR